MHLRRTELKPADLGACPSICCHCCLEVTSFRRGLLALNGKENAQKRADCSQHQQCEAHHNRLLHHFPATCNNNSVAGINLFMFLCNRICKQSSFKSSETMDLTNIIKWITIFKPFRLILTANWSKLCTSRSREEISYGACAFPPWLHNINFCNQWLCKASYPSLLCNTS